MQEFENFYHSEDPAEEVIEKMGGSYFFQKKFLEQRRVFLWGPVTDDSAKYIIDRLMYLEMIKPGEDISFFINSPGGIVTSGMAIYDTMEMISSPVSTICMGLAASMGSILLSGGAKGKRYVFPNGRVMIHQPSLGQYVGTASDIEIQTNEILKTRELGAKILSENCGQPYEKVLEDFSRDYWMNAQESKDYGIVDDVYNKLN